MSTSSSYSYKAILLGIVCLLLTLGFLSLAPPFPTASSNNTRKSRYIVITGCNNYCNVACCYCNIHRFPPVCEKCCK
ncbi:hypothetical protein BRADI_3g04315v3 [Brachypodium distachyon]|uniref:Uncharacterized protein n=1 Tax=Brachypodium distachyon TaxID=15368 RepID=A0A0Q3PVE3_BRADI|nr:hypothetical protein BRADI_3g04315v3 [Brachypodium distachyon]